MGQRRRGTNRDHSLGAARDWTECGKPRRFLGKIVRAPRPHGPDGSVSPARETPGGSHGRSHSGELLASGNSFSPTRSALDCDCFERFIKPAPRPSRTGRQTVGSRGARRFTLARSKNYAQLLLAGDAIGCATLMPDCSCVISYRSHFAHGPVGS